MLWWTNDIHAPTAAIPIGNCRFAQDAFNANVGRLLEPRATAFRLLTALRKRSTDRRGGGRSDVRAGGGRLGRRALGCLGQVGFGLSRLGA